MLCFTLTKEKGLRRIRSKCGHWPVVSFTFMMGDRHLTITIVWPLMGYPIFPYKHLAGYPILRTATKSITEKERLIYTQNARA